MVVPIEHSTVRSRHWRMSWVKQHIGFGWTFSVLRSPWALYYQCICYIQLIERNFILIFWNLPAYHKALFPGVASRVCTPFLLETYVWVASISEISFSYLSKHIAFQNSMHLLFFFFQNSLQKVFMVFNKTIPLSRNRSLPEHYWHFKRNRKYRRRFSFLQTPVFPKIFDILRLA